MPSKVYISGLGFYSEIPAEIGPLNDVTYVAFNMFNSTFGCPDTNMGSSAENGEITLGFSAGSLILFFRLMFMGIANTTYVISALAGGFPIQWEVEKHDPNGLNYLDLSLFGAAYVDPVLGVPIQIGIRTKQSRPGATVLVKASQFFIMSLLP